MDRKTKDKNKNLLNKPKEKLMYLLIGLATTFTIGILICIISFVFINGFKHIGLDFITSNYDSETQYLEISVIKDYVNNKIGIEFGTGNYEDKEVIIVKSIEKNSLANEIIKEVEGNTVLVKVTRQGEGILPMLVTTLFIILISLLIACPIGIFSAIYLTEYAKQGRLVRIIRFATESLAGIPSIIYGLFGMIFFVITLKLNYSILSGSLTLSIILLPVIIRQTEESLKTVPNSIREGSLGLGATKLQTIIKVVLPSAINGIIAVDKDYKIFLYNDILTEILNINEKEIEGKSIYEVIRNLDIFNVLENSIEQEEHTVDETRISGIEDKIIRVYASPIISNKSNKKTLGTLLVIQDVTQIRKLETMRSDFVSNVTHELKTPLTSIRGFVDTLKNGAIKDEKNANRFLNIIDIETERLSLLIGDILSLSEIENMKNEKSTNDNDIGEIIEEVVNILHPKVKNKNIELLTSISDDLNPFRCNRNRIKQLLINLVDNAINYTDEGYVKISCKEDYHYLTIEIEDTGIGIGKKYLPRLFERFYRIDKGRSRKIGGTGLGLSIAKHIVELYNGTIKVESELGKGTKFIVKLEKS